MNRVIVSVVIPVYKVEAYIERCVKSVLNQSMKDLEVILVDDGSPDHCPEICDEYANQDDRVKVIHKTNGGLASARNSGMKIASGKYLFFLDSDDWLEADGLEILYKKAEEYQVDFVRYRAIRTGWPGLNENAPCYVEKVRELEEGYYDKDKILEKVYPRLLATSQLTMGAIVGAWGSLYSLDFLNKNHLRFYEEVKFSEDLIFSANVVRAASSFYFINQPGIYHYYYNPNSISKSFRPERWESCKSLIRLCEKDFARDQEYDFSNQLQYLRWFCIMLGLNERRFIADKRQREQYCKELIMDDIVQNTKLSFDILDVGWKQKILMLFIHWRISWVIAII